MSPIPLHLLFIEPRLEHISQKTSHDFYIYIKLQKSENIEDLGQQYEEFNNQDEKDVQQQLIDMNAEAEDLTQQQVDINKDDGGNSQKLLENYAREYNSHYHGEKESADEYEAEVSLI